MNINRLSAYFSLCIILLSGCSSTITTKSSEQLIRQPYTSTVDQATHQYFVYLPKGYESEQDKQWPVLIFLHGNGERGNGLDELDYVITHGPLYEAWVQKRDLPFIIIAPQLPMFGQDKGKAYLTNRDISKVPKRLAQGTPSRASRPNYQQPIISVTDVKDMSNVPALLPMGWEQVEQDLLNILAQTHKTYRTQVNKTYLTGLSYGGFGTWYMASKHPELFSAIVPVVGWGHPSLMNPIAKANLPVWVFAGGRDNVIPKKYFYAGINELEKLGHTNYRFTIHEDMGHATWTRVYEGEDVYNWMLKQTK